MVRNPILATVLTIVGLVGTICLIAVAVTLAVPLRWEIGLPVPVRILGIGILGFGLATLAWLLRYRRMKDVLVSTHVSLLKLARRVPMADRLDRTEPLVVVGPYRIVRHPMYSAVTLMNLGLGIALDLTAIVLAAAFLFLWFAFVLGPFEERELVALFGPSYEEYMRRTPRIIPIPRRRPRTR